MRSTREIKLFEIIVSIFIQICHTSEKLTKQPVQKHSLNLIRDNVTRGLMCREILARERRVTVRTALLMRVIIGEVQVILSYMRPTIHKIYICIYICIHHLAKLDAREIRISRTTCRTMANPRHRNDLTTRVMNNRRKPRTAPSSATVVFRLGPPTFRDIVALPGDNRLPVHSRRRYLCGMHRARGYCWKQPCTSCTCAFQ